MAHCRITMQIKAPGIFEKFMHVHNLIAIVVK